METRANQLHDTQTFYSTPVLAQTKFRAKICPDDKIWCHSNPNFSGRWAPDLIKEVSHSQLCVTCHGMPTLSNIFHTFCWIYKEKRRFHTSWYLQLVEACSPTTRSMQEPDKIVTVARDNTHKYTGRRSNWLTSGVGTLLFPHKFWKEDSLCLKKNVNVFD